MQVSVSRWLFPLALLVAGCLPQHTYEPPHEFPFERRPEGTPITGAEILQSTREGLSEPALRHLGEEVGYLRFATVVEVRSRKWSLVGFFEGRPSRRIKTRTVTAIECLRTAGVDYIPIMVGQALEGTDFNDETAYEMLLTTELVHPFAAQVAQAICKIDDDVDYRVLKRRAQVLDTLVFPLLIPRSERARLKHRFIQTVMERFDGGPLDRAESEQLMIIFSDGEWGIDHHARFGQELLDWWKENSRFLHWQAVRQLERFDGRFEVNEDARKEGRCVDPGELLTGRPRDIERLRRVGEARRQHMQPPRGHSWCTSCGNMLPVDKVASTVESPLWECVRCGKRHRGEFADDPVESLRNKVRRIEPDE